jgi:hypothetical protein
MNATSGLVHASIIGPTLCGKTTLAQYLCDDFTKNGVKCLVLDPYNGIWNCAYQTRSITEFIRIAKQSRSCALFFDEIGQLDMRDKEHEWLVTGSRHWGHVAHMIGQSGIQMTPLARSSMTRLYLFKSDKDTADFWRKTFVDDRIMQATTLARFEFLRCEMFGQVTRSNLLLK